LAASSSPNLQYCANCGTSLSPGALSCPNCGRFTYADQLKEIATRARQLLAVGQLQAAKEHWLAALKVLPPGSNEYQAVLREVAQIDARLNPQPKPDWRKRLGPFGVIIAFFAKYKFLLYGLLKFKMFFSLFAFFGVYWALFGWWFAVGMCGSIMIHEMGHYVVVRRFGFAAELPMFIPGFGAYVKWQGAGVDVGTRALISLAGPLFGFASGIAAYGIYLLTGSGVWLAVAHFAGWINLLNLIPIGFFDGGSAIQALGRQQRLALLLVSLALLFLLRDLLLIGVAAATAFRMWRGDYPAEPRERIALYFIALVIANGFLSWFSALPAHP
jgi:Zn-dependent protease